MRQGRHSYNSYQDRKPDLAPCHLPCQDVGTLNSVDSFIPHLQILLLMHSIDCIRNPRLIAYSKYHVLLLNVEKSDLEAPSNRRI